MKKLFTIIALTSALAISACSETTTYADSSFISKMEKNIDARGRFADKEHEDTLNWYRSLIDIESNIHEFETAEFQDMRLKKLAEDYIDGLKLQEDALDYFSDDSKFLEKWESGFDKRSVALSKLVDEYNLKISDITRDSLIQNAKAVNAETSEKETMQALYDTITFEKEKSSGNWATYTAIVENTTEFNFEYVNLEINLIKDDIIQETAYSNIGNWDAGTKAKFEFSTDEDFDSYKIKGSYSITK